MYKNIPGYRAVSGDIFSSSETIETGNRGTVPLFYFTGKRSLPAYVV